MSLNVEHIESGQAARLDKTEKPKPGNGEGFSALLATLSAELRSFSGVSPEMALPIDAAKQSGINHDTRPRDAAPDTDRGSDLDDGGRAETSAASPTSTDSRGRARSDRTDEVDNQDARHTERANSASTAAGRTDSADDGSSDMTVGAATAAAGNARGGEQNAAPAIRNGAAAQLLTGQPGAPRAGAEEFRTLAAVREAAAPTQSGAYKPTGGSDGNALRASVSDQGTGLASQPTASLAASATVNAQLGRGAKPVSTGLNDGALSPDEGAALRSDLQSVPGTVKTLTPAAAKAASQDAAPGDLANRPNAGSQPAPSAAAQAAPAMPAQLANTAMSSGNLGQIGQPAPGQIADGAMANSAPANQNQAAARTRPTAFAGHMRNTPQPMPTAEQVAIQIQRALGNGTDRINIQLRPQELGRVEVRMEVGHDGKLLAVISADKPETLDLLQRDQRSLQDALSNAGLDLDSNSLSFNLNGQDDGQAVGDNGGDGSETGTDDEDLSDDAALAASGHVDVITEDRIDVVL